MDNIIKKKNREKFNIYIFLSTFARSLIEVFIGTILYKAGYELKEVMFYYLMVNVFSVLLVYPCILLLKKHCYKIMIFLEIISFFMLQVLLNSVRINSIFLIIIAFLFALYRRIYWMSRRFYNLEVIEKENVAKDYSIISILNQIALLLSGYIGAIMLEFVDIKILTVLSTLLFLISSIFMFQIEETKNDNVKLELKVTFKNLLNPEMITYGCYELLNVIKFLIPLYLVIHVSNTYTIIGIVNLIVNLATIIFTYIYGRIINKEKNYLKLSIVIVLMLYIFKINTSGGLLMLVSFLEGLGVKMYEQSVQKVFLVISKKHDYYNSIFLYEFVQNVFRTICMLVIFFFIRDLKMMIYFTLVLMAIPLALKTKNIKKEL